jgi:dTDP-4-amino-4,6-dideoxygalactose transaminase
LQLAYHALGVGPGRDLVTTANTFLATATAAQMCGAEVEFVDIDARTGNLDVAALEARLERGLVPHVVTAVHFAGLPCQMEWLLALKRRHDFLLVEDAAHALGARYQVEGRWYRVGEHPEVDATILSFHPVKHITTGEGGAILVHAAELAERLRRIRAHGVDPAGELGLPPFQRRTAEEFTPDGRHTPWFKPMLELGFNYRLTDLQAALGTSQLTRLDSFLERRRQIARRYSGELVGFQLPAVPADREHAWHLFVVHCPADERDALLAHLHREHVRAQVHYYPVPLQPWFRARNRGAVFPRAEEHAQSAISLPMHAALTDEQQEHVLELLNAWRRRAAA